MSSGIGMGEGPGWCLTTVITSRVIRLLGLMSLRISIELEALHDDIV